MSRSEPVREGGSDSRSAGLEPARGAFVISLDFELHWGERDFIRPGSPRMGKFIGARAAVPAMLELFEEFGIAATWATVGLLMAETREEQIAFRPTVLPDYPDQKDNPYLETVGEDEKADPMHLAWSLVKRIAATPRQEVASHTFSHYHCLQAGSSAESFAADLASARAIAAYRGLDVTSLVLPRNQLSESLYPVIQASGFRAYRGNPSDFLNRPHDRIKAAAPVRALRLLDIYLPITANTLGAWPDGNTAGELVNVPASRLLRRYTHSLRSLEPRRIRRITQGLEQAARQGRIYHLWWHPHTFGRDLDQNLKTLRAILTGFDRLRSELGMRSVTMRDVAASAS